jgi:hypothetical protein
MPPTEEEVVRSFDEEILLYYSVPKQRGYHLIKFNPEFRAGMTRLLECNWTEMCVHWTLDGAPDQQERLDWEFQRCTEAHPEHPTCNAYTFPVAGEPTSSIECRAQAEAVVMPDSCSDNEIGFPGLPNPDGFDDPITIDIGKSVFDISG